MKRKIRVVSNRLARHMRIRKHVMGTSERPRVCVFRSSKHFEAQLIDDLSGRTLLSASTRDKDIRKKVKYGGNRTAAKVVGGIFADRVKKRVCKQSCSIVRGICITDV